MDFRQYEIEAGVTRPHYDNVLHNLITAALGMNGEAGEFADLIKKHIAQGHPLNTEQLVKELGDQLWYLADACFAIGVSLETVAMKNIEKLRARYPGGYFEAERSLNRASGDA